MVRQGIFVYTRAMLQIITGSDTQARRESRARILQTRSAIEVSSHQNALEVIFEQVLAQGGFFGEQQSVVVKNASEISELVGFLEKHGTTLQESDLVIILDDREFTLAQVKYFQKQKFEIISCDLPKEQEVNIFGITDALASGSKRQVYGVYHRMIKNGVDAEEMAVPIWWWLKGLGQTRQGVRTAKPFAQKKFDMAARLFGESIPRMITDYAIAIDNSRTSGNLELELEQWMMKSMIKN